MGNSSGRGALEAVYANYDKNLTTRLGAADKADAAAVMGGSENFIGGGESFTGGYDALHDYGNSLFSRAKEKLIRDIASEVFSALKISGAKNAKTAPISDVVAHLKKLSPNPSKGKKFNDSFNSSSGKQKSVCHALANAINSNYGGSIINMNAGDNEMCNQVAEVMYSLFTGLHTEFINVAGDVMRVMRNMQTVNSALEAAYRKQVELIQSSGDARLKDQSNNTNQLYSEIKSEYDRQAAVLANMMNVAVGPTGKSLISSLEDNRDFAGLVKDLKAETGTTAFGDKLAHLLSGVSTVAHSAELVDKALKKLGMSTSEFKSAKSASDLRSRIYAHIVKDNPNSKALDEMMDAAQIIYNNNYDHDAIAKLVKGKGESYGGDANGGVDGGSDSDDGSVHGGDDDDLAPYWAKKSLSKKIANKEKYRNLVFKDFRRMLKANYQRIVDAANHIAQKIGGEIPLSDDLDAFVKAFTLLPKLDEEKLHIALSGYAKDSVSREKREKFMNDYELVNSTIVPLTKGPAGASFKEIQSTINQMLKTVNDFSEKMVKAITEIHVDHPAEIQAALRKTASSIYGSGDSGEDSFGSGSWVAFEKIQAEMKYFYAIANIKTNMARMVNEVGDYGEGYEQLLGEEAGWLINQIKQEYKDILENIDPAVDVSTKAGVNERAKAINAALRNADSGASDEARQVTYKNLVKIMTEQMNAKVNMVKVAQAVDLYLKAFTNGIARNPDSVGSVVKMLDQVEIVAKWFNDRSGDNISYLFECFPNSHDGTDPKYSEVLTKDADELKMPAAGSHYYDWVEKQAASGNGLPGNPFLGRPLSETKEKGLDAMLNLSEKVVKSMRALENILSVFSSVGAKFGDVNPAAQTFMTPGQIFNHLTAYIKASAFTTQFAPVVNDTTDASTITAAIYRGKINEKNIKKSDGSDAKGVPAKVAQANTRPACVDDDIDAVLTASSRLAELQALNVAGKAETKVDRKVTAENGILTGVANAHNAKTSRKYTSIAMAAIPADGEYKADAAKAVGDPYVTSPWSYHDYSANAGERKDRLDMAGWQDAFYDTDLLFEMVIKSIVCKVFTVVDAYRLFHRPTVDRNNGNMTHSSLNPLRTIMGGADGGASLAMVKVIPEALELYFRLPLLAEWYRELFSINEKTTLNSAVPLINPEWKLSIIPSIDGVWSGFVAAVFEKADYVKEGNYSESQVQMLINEMNSIYKVYKSKYPKATVRNIINAFIMEMNRIFGFLKKSEIDKWQENKRKFLTSPPGDSKEDEFLDFDILSANDQFGDRPAPSDRFVNVGLSSNPNKKTLTRVHMQQSIDQLRRAMDVEFLKHATSTANDFKFIETLKNYKNEMLTAKGDLEAYRLVLRMIQGANRQVVASVDRLIMLHEAVAAPLAVVYGAYKVLSKFNALMHGTSLVNIDAWNVGRKAKTATAGVDQLNTNKNARDEFLKYCKTVGYTKALNDNHELDLFGQILFGNDSSKAPGQAGYLVNATVAKDAEIVKADIKADKIAQDLISAILDLTSSDSTLVNCSVGTGGAINLDYSKLQDLCLSLLEQVKANIKKLRVSFSSDVGSVDKYEEAKNVGSVRWLEENMVQILFTDRDRTGLETGMTTHLRPTMEKLSDPAKCGSLAPALRRLVYYGYTGKEMNASKFTANNPTKFPFSVMNFATLPESKLEKATLATLSMGSTTAVADTSYLKIPIVGFEDKDQIMRFNMGDVPKSLMISLNKIVSMYVFNNLDDGPNKFYVPLIESFVNTAASLEVIQGKAFPNVSTIHISTGDLGNALAGDTADVAPPPKGTVLYASNAWMLKSILQTTQVLGNVQKKRFAYESLAEVPEYIKDRMKCNLPYFSKLLQNLYSRADLLKRMLNSLLKKNVAESKQGGVQMRDHGAMDGQNLQVVLHKDPLNTNESNTEFLNSLLDRILDCSASLKRCADGVYKELNDKLPYFLETNKDFASDYKQRTGHLPLMPASSLLAALTVLEGDDANKWTSLDASHLILPTRENGSPAYKFNYGARAVLSRDDVEPQMEHFPGAKELYNNYAAKEGSVPVISSSEYANTVKLMARLTRFLANGASYGRLYETDGRNYTQPGEAGHNSNSVFNQLRWTTEGITGKNKHKHSGKGLSNADLSDNLAVFALADAPSLNTVIDLTENTSYDASKEKLAEVLGVGLGSAPGNERAKLRVLNILDMNVVPINVHAFMREVPFVNLLNYSYTFDRMVHDFVLPSYVTDKKGAVNMDNLMIKPNEDISSTRELLVKLLCHPWADLGTDGKQYFALAASLFNGNDNMKLGRPRYLSDQLWHKALLTSSAQLVANQASFSDATGAKFDKDLASLEAGPAAYEAVRAVVRYAAPGYDETDSLHRQLKPNDDALRVRNLAKNQYDAMIATAGVAATRMDPIKALSEGKTATLVIDTDVLNFVGIDGPAELKYIETTLKNALTTRANILSEVTLVMRSYTSNSVDVATKLAAAKIALRANCNLEKGLDILVTHGGGGVGGTVDAEAKVVTAAADGAKVPADGAEDVKVRTVLSSGDANAAAAEWFTPKKDTIITNLANYLESKMEEKKAANNATKKATKKAMARMYAEAAFFAVNANLAASATDIETELKKIDAEYKAVGAKRNAFGGTVQIDDTTATNKKAALGITEWAKVDNTANAEQKVWHAYAIARADGCTDILNNLINITRNLVRKNMIAKLVEAAPDALGSLRDIVRTMYNGLAEGKYGDVAAALEAVVPRADVLAGDKSVGPFSPYQRVALLALHQQVASKNTIAGLLNGPAIPSFNSGNLLMLMDTWGLFAGVVAAVQSKLLTSSRKNLTLIIPASPVTTMGLKYWDTNAKTWSVNPSGNNMAIEDVLYCAELGKARFDTKLVRNLTWLVQLQRIMRVVLINHLSWLNTPVVRGLKIADPNVTEYDGNAQYDSKDFTGENYSTL
jgi:hypothetical protein